MPARVSDPIVRSFLERYGYLRKQLKRELRSFIASPNEENVHDLRSAIRRINSAFGVLPQLDGEHDRLIKKYVKSDKRIMKLTSPIRDIDIIRQKLDESSNKLCSEELRISLRSRRLVELIQPEKEARKLSEKRVPVLRAKELVGLKESINKENRQLKKEIETYLSATLSSENYLSDLHSLRKTIKRFRYTLELLPESPGRTKDLRSLAKWQDYLGEILECHVFETYLSSLSPSEFTESSLRETSERRKERYDRLLNGRNRNVFLRSGRVKVKN